MKTETSAGGVVVAHTAKGWFVLLMRDMNGTLTFPKGMIEPDEDPRTAAEREIAEEVGVTGLKLLRPLETIGYVYRRNGTIKKSVHYFLFLSKHRQQTHVQREEGITEALWVPIGNAVTEVGYSATNKPLLLRTRRWLTKHAAEFTSRR